MEVNNFIGVCQHAKPMQEREFGTGNSIQKNQILIRVDQILGS